MGNFDPVYSDEQRGAIHRAGLELGMKPARRIAEAAAAGELTFDGAQLEPFTIPANTIRDMLSRERRRRAGELTSAAAKAGPDGLEGLRRRLLSAVEHELNRCETAQRRGRTVPGEQLRQLARALREASSIPLPGAPTPPAPGQRAPAPGDGTRGQPNGARTTGGIGGAILAAARAPAPALAPGSEPGPSTSPSSTPAGEPAPPPSATHNGTPRAEHHSLEGKGSSIDQDDGERAEDEAAPDSYARKMAHQLGLGSLLEGEGTHEDHEHAANGAQSLQPRAATGA